MSPTLPFCQYKQFMESRYGAALYRVPVDLGFGCPNRSAGGSGGCAFCAGDGGRARQITGRQTLLEQVEAGLAFARRRYGARKFMLYIQAYTGTFGPLPEIRQALRQLTEGEHFAAIGVGTRPDCLPDAVVDLLAELGQTAEMWVELGVQTTHDDTLRRINRGHDWAASRDAILRLAGRGLLVAPHVIIGLPGEGPDEWNLTACRLAELPVAGIKIHNLHVLKGTALADEFAMAPFPLLDEHRYADALIAFLRRLPPGLPIMRLTTDTPGEQLAGPRWNLSKGQFLDLLVRRMHFLKVRQGDLSAARRAGEKTPGKPDDQLRALPTDDGSVTFWNPLFKEHYHSKVGALTEAVGKFVEPARLAGRLANGDLRLLDVCFGLGYNTLAACQVAEETRKGRLTVAALEIDAGVVAAAARAMRTPHHSPFDWRRCLEHLAADGHWEAPRSAIQLVLGDARAKLEQAAAAGRFDVVFLDAFSTQRNAELWTLDFFRQLKNAMSANAVLLTYCAALPVRSALIQAGFLVGETTPVGRQRGGTLAALDPVWIDRPLPPGELETINTTPRGIPYRDPALTATNRQILRHRETEIQRWKTHAAP